VWTASPEIATPALGPGIPAAIGFGIAGGILLAWVALAFVVVQSAEMMPGAPLHPKNAPRRALSGRGLSSRGAGAPDRGGVHGARVGGGTRGGCGAALGRGFRGCEAGAFADLPRVLVASDSGDATRTIEAILAADSPFRAGAGGPVSVTTPGFAEAWATSATLRPSAASATSPAAPRSVRPFKGEVAVHHAVSPDTFQMAGIEVLEGRGFTPADGPAAEPVAIVSRRFAAEHFQNGEAIGRRVRIGAARDRWHTVVGIVDALPRTRLPARTQPPEDIFVPIASFPRPRSR
jgi:hypothetical protein